MYSTLKAALDRPFWGILLFALLTIVIAVK
jgi:hypothetical protein